LEFGDVGRMIEVSKFLFRPDAAPQFFPGGLSVGGIIATPQEPYRRANPRKKLSQSQDTKANVKDRNAARQSALLVFSWRNSYGGIEITSSPITVRLHTWLQARSHSARL
jgi:hypothetical protein